MSEEYTENGKLNEAETIATLINPALHKKGWTEDVIKREVPAGAIRIINGVPRQQRKGRADIVLRLQPTPKKQLVSASVIEAKAEKFSPTLGLEQAKKYALRLHVPFVYSTNGHRFVEYDRITGIISHPKAFSEFPDVQNLRDRFEDLFTYLLETGGAEQKTIIFCNSDRHADLIAATMERIYVKWCQKNNHKRVESYAFKCTEVTVKEAGR